MWLGLALLALLLGLVSVAMLLKSEPPPAERLPRPAPPDPPSVVPAPAVAPLPPKARSAPIVSLPTPADLSRLEDEGVTLIASRAKVAAALRLVAPTYADDDARDGATLGVSLRTDGAFRATRGTKRERHEDAFSVLPSGVYAIADGAGGHAGGNVASRTAIDALEQALATGDVPRAAFLEAVSHQAETLVGAVMSANAAVRKKAASDPDLAGMGTTLLALKVDAAAERIYIAHVGDSRCYRVRGGVLTQLTTDHVVTEKTESGEERSMLGRAVGASERVDVDLIIGTARAGDRYVLCTDGLHHALAEAEIAAVLDGEPDLYAAVAKLVETAEKKDGSDNISVVLIDVRA